VRCTRGARDCARRCGWVGSRARAGSRYENSQMEP
jgi:hypothetical protein